MTVGVADGVADTLAVGISVDGYAVEAILGVVDEFEIVAIDKFFEIESQ